MISLSVIRGHKDKIFNGALLPRLLKPPYQNLIISQEIPTEKKMSKKVAMDFFGNKLPNFLTSQGSIQEVTQKSKPKGIS